MAIAAMTLNELRDRLAQISAREGNLPIFIEEYALAQVLLCEPDVARELPKRVELWVETVDEVNLETDTGEIAPVRAKRRKKNY